MEIGHPKEIKLFLVMSARACRVKSEKALIECREGLPTRGIYGVQVTLVPPERQQIEILEATLNQLMQHVLDTLGDAVLHCYKEIEEGAAQIRLSIRGIPAEPLQDLVRQGQEPPVQLGFRGASWVIHGTPLTDILLGLRRTAILPRLPDFSRPKTPPKYLRRKRAIRTSGSSSDSPDTDEPLRKRLKSRPISKLTERALHALSVGSDPSQVGAPLESQDLFSGQFTGAELEYGPEALETARKQVEKPNKQWVKRTWIPPLLSEVTSLPTLTKVQIAREMKESRTAEHISEHSQQKLVDAAVLDIIPSDPKGMSVIQSARENADVPVPLLAAALDLKASDPTKPGLYLKVTSTPTSRVSKALQIIGNNKPTRQRARIAGNGRRAYQHRLAVQPNWSRMHWLYFGTSDNTLARPNWFIYDALKEGSQEEDDRKPDHVMANIGGGAATWADIAIIWCTSQGRYAIMADKDWRSTDPLPPIVYIFLFNFADLPNIVRLRGETSLICAFGPLLLNADAGGERHFLLESWLSNALEKWRKTLEDPEDVNRELLFLADATGVKGRSFVECRSGRFLINIFSDILGIEAALRVVNWHQDVGHESNDEIIVIVDIIVIIDTIKPGNIFIIILGVIVALVNSNVHLFEEDIINTPFFTLKVVTINGHTHIVMVYPHPGNENYREWILWPQQMLSYASALTAIVADKVSKHKKAGTPREEIPHHILQEVTQDPLASHLIKILEAGGIRQAWCGPYMGPIQRILDANPEMTVRDALIIAKSRPGRPLIRSFAAPTEEDPRLDHIIQIEETSAVNAKNFLTYPCEQVDHEEQLSNDSASPLLVPYPTLFIGSRWRPPRGTGPVQGHLVLSENGTLMFQKLDKKLYFNEGHPFHYSPARWMTQQGFGPNTKLLEGHYQKLFGAPLKLSEYQRREKAAYEDSAQKVTHQSHLIQTWSRRQTRKAVSSGSVQPFSLRGKYIEFSVWDPTANKFCKFGPASTGFPIEFLQLANPQATHFIPVCDYEDHLDPTKPWCFSVSFLLFKWTPDDGEFPTYIGDHPEKLTSRSCMWVKHSSATALFQLELQDHWQSICKT